MDILDAVAHLYERDQLNDDREPPIRPAVAMGLAIFLKKDFNFI